MQLARCRCVHANERWWPTSRSHRLGVVHAVVRGGPPPCPPRQWPALAATTVTLLRPATACDSHTEVKRCCKASKAPVAAGMRYDCLSCSHFFYVQTRAVWYNAAVSDVIFCILLLPLLTPIYILLVTETNQKELAALYTVHVEVGLSLPSKELLLSTK